MYKTELFELIFNEDGTDCYLKYLDKPLIIGCSNILTLFLELSLTTPPIIERLDLDEFDENELENMLRRAVLSDGNCLTQ